ncbi:hypothetical protein DL95DRAFT_396444, partial [Leptodontidium sp. 2 PMI_412]
MIVQVLSQLNSTELNSIQTKRIHPMPHPRCFTSQVNSDRREKEERKADLTPFLLS